MNYYQYVNQLEEMKYDGYVSQNDVLPIRISGLKKEQSKNRGGTLNQYNKSDDDCLERSWSRTQMQYLNDVPIGLEFVLDSMESNRT